MTQEKEVIRLWGELVDETALNHHMSKCEASSLLYQVLEFTEKVPEFSNVFREIEHVIIANVHDEITKVCISGK